MLDLHIHSNLSDGALDIKQLVQKIKVHQITHAILTDHDCVIGTNDFINECCKNNINSSTGVELQAYYNVEKSLYLHMLCYNFKDYELLNNFLEEQRKQRIEGINNAIKYLKDFDIEIDFADVTKMSEGRHLLINHLCLYLEKMGYMNYEFSYKLFCDENSKYYIDYPKHDVRDIIDFIHRVGGLAVLAHPKRLHLNVADLDNYIKSLKNIGLDGIETYYGFNTLEETKLSENLAEKYGLLETIGSDWHCDSDKTQIGVQDISQKKKELILRRIFNE